MPRNLTNCQSEMSSVGSGGSLGPSGSGGWAVCLAGAADLSLVAALSHNLPREPFSAGAVLWAVGVAVGVALVWALPPEAAWFHKSPATPAWAWE